MIKRKIALSIKNSRLGPLFIKLGVRKWTFARRLYGKLTKINKKTPIKVGKYKIFLDENDSLGLLKKKDFYEKSHPAKIMKKFVKEGDNYIEILVYSTLANHYSTIPTPSLYRQSYEAGLIGPV